MQAQEQLQRQRVDADTDAGVAPHAGDTTGQQWVPGESREVKRSDSTVSVWTDLPTEDASARRTCMDRMITEMFDTLDVNGDGHLSSKELYIGLYRQFKLALTPAEFRKVMRVMDPDRDGTVDRDEFRAALFDHAGHT